MVIASHLTGFRFALLLIIRLKQIILIKAPLYSTLIFVFLFLSSSFLLGQTTDEESLRESAEEYFAAENYEQAFSLYSQLLSLRIESADYNYHFGASQLFYGENKEKALQYLKFAIEKSDAPPLAYFYYGLGLHLNYRFDRAIDYYQKYQSLGNKKDREMGLVEHYILQCSNGKNLVSNFSDISVIQKEVLPIRDFYRNYDLSEFGGKIIVKPEDFMSEEDIKRDATFLMYFQKDADKFYYGSYSNKNQTGKDLYVTTKNASGDWGKSERLSDVINTPLDEDFPFIYPGSNTLYFASKGHNGMGGYDIFKSTLLPDGSWTKPINMEFAINTPWDDFLFITDKQEVNAWFSSNRETGSKEVTVYNIGIQKIPLDLTLIKGEFISEGSRKSLITIEDMIQNKTIGTYESSGLDGTYLIDLKGSGKYKFIVEAKESNKIHTGTVEIPRQKGLKQFRQEMKLVMINGVEQLQIINHFDEEIADESLVNSDVLKKQASLKVNINDPTSTDVPLAENATGNEETNAAETEDVKEGDASEVKTKEELLAEAKLQQAELNGDVEFMNQKATYLYNQANEYKNSSDEEEVAKATIAIELASLYNNEAEKRAIASDQMENTLTTLEGSNLDDNTFNASLNKATVSASNFEKLEVFEAKVPKVITARIEAKKKEFNQNESSSTSLEADIEGINDEISYLKTQISREKDNVVKAEYEFQLKSAQEAKPKKEAQLASLKQAAESADVNKKAIEKYLEITNDLITATDENAESTAGSITPAQISSAKEELLAKASSIEILYALVAPEKAAAQLAEANKEFDTNQSVASAEVSRNSNNQKSTPETGNNELAANENEEGTIETGLPIETENEISEVQGTEPQKSTTRAEENRSLNEEIKEIEASRSQPVIIGGDFDEYFDEKIAEASNAEDKILSESTKAEIYDQWVENLTYRIDSIEQELETAPTQDAKLALLSESEVLKEERQTKEDLAMQSYQAIATLSDEAATNNSAKTVNSKTSVDQKVNLSASTGETNPEIKKINEKYGQQLAQAKSINDPLERTTKEAAVNMAWSDELSDQIEVLEAKISDNPGSPEEKELKAQLTSVVATRDEKQTNYETQQKQAQALASGENEALSQVEIEAKLQEYVENYDRAGFEKLEGDININPDENQRLVLTNTMTRNWMISLRNQIIKKEARKRNSADPKQIKELDEELVQLEKEKLMVQAKLDALDIEGLSSTPSTSSKVIVEGSERFEGYQPVVDAETLAEADENLASKIKVYSDLDSELSSLKSALAGTNKNSEKAELEEQISLKEKEIEIVKTEKDFAAKQKNVIVTIEKDLLQMKPGDKTPAEREASEAMAQTARATQNMTHAQTLLNEALKIKKKKEREPAVAEAEIAMAEAKSMKKEADLMQELAFKVGQIERKAIEENYIIPRGKEVELPVLNKKLNPAEQADIVKTTEFKTYNSEIEKAATLRKESLQLKNLEVSLQERAQAQLAQVTASDTKEREAQSIEAFDLFEKADSVSALSAKKTRQAAFVENKANASLLAEPEEVYLNVLAYYTTTGTPNASLDETIVAYEEDLDFVSDSLSNPDLFKMDFDEMKAEKDLAKQNSSATTQANPILESGQADLSTESNPNELATSVNEVVTQSPNSESIDNEVIDQTSSTKPISPNAGNAGTNNGITNQTRATTGAVTPPNNQSSQVRQTASPNNDTAEGNSAQNFDLLPPTQDASTRTGNNYANGRLRITQDVLTQTIFDLAPDAGIKPATPVSARSKEIAVDAPMPAGVVYKIQIGAFSKPMTIDRLKGITPLAGETTSNGYIRYTAGQFPDFVSADAAKDALQEIGFPDAFVVAYRNGFRTSVEETVAYEGKALEEIPTPLVRDAYYAKNAVGNSPTRPTNPTPVASSTIENSDQSLVNRGALIVRNVNELGPIFYTVQVGVFSRAVKSSDIYDITPLNEESLSNGTYRYSNGVFNDFATADQAKLEIRRIGVKDAFVTAYREGKRIDVETARQVLNDQTGTTDTPTPAASQASSNQTYRILLGEYSGEIPLKEATVLLGLSSKGVEKITDENGVNKYYLGNFINKEGAEFEVNNLKSLGLVNARVVTR